ncbi:MAG: translation initiation factor IF-2 associated domain-containing protein, partial [Alphaproteobacteria bacterium]|nr:translation initiation factor IF-2 associated domain-containing protein [Alphaproteobacteria bacterium]
MPPRVSTPATETTPATTSATSKKPAGPRKKLQISDKARETGQITQSFSHRRTKTVQIEVKRRQPSAKNKAKPGAREAPPRPAAAADNNGIRASELI